MPRIFGPDDVRAKPARRVLAATCLLLLAIGLAPAADAFSTTSISRATAIHSSPSSKLGAGKLHASTIADSDTAASTEGGSTSNGAVQTRTLGSQELLMLPRQYSPSPTPFPQMNHVCVATLSATPPVASLLTAIENAMKTHPLLRSHVEGSGEPDERIDLFNMVRKGNPDPERFVAPNNGQDVGFTAQNVLKVVGVDANNDSALSQSWEEAFRRDLDDGSWCTTATGPLWKVELHRSANNDVGSDAPCALVLSFNHAISDQSSANLLLDQLLSDISDIDAKSTVHAPAIPQSMPLSLEESVLGVGKSFEDVQTDDITLDTIKYVASKAAEGFKSPVILPDDNTSAEDDGSGLVGALSTISGNSAGGADAGGAAARKSAVSFRTLDKAATEALLAKCRKEKVSVTNALTAAVALTATDFIGSGDGQNSGKERNYKVLQSLDMRRFGAQLDSCETVACMAGSMDLMLGPFPDKSGGSVRGTAAGSYETSQFWDLAREGKKQTADFVESGGPAQATRVFDAFMTIADGNNLVHLTSESAASQGRAYSAGVSNVGVFERQRAVKREGEPDRDSLMSKHGKYEIQDIFFATPHSRSGCLYQVSGQTINGEMKLTFHPAKPIISEETNAAFADAFIDLLEVAAGVKEPSTEKAEMSNGLLSMIPSNALSLAALAFSIGGVAIHGGAWADFFHSINEMKANVADPADATAAINFWIFFAVGHPILQPILWISDVLHGTPGPKIADLVPYLFLAGNLVAIGAITFSKEIRNAVNIAALGAFLAYVGAGLDGQAGLGDFNLALDDQYKGQIVKGCPAYDEVRQPSMNNFDLEKYQGKWYEHKFHDWTQFKEVYDTTLDIKLTPDGKGWIDDFAVKGPAPKAAPLSWDKSPVANGAHYYLFGRVDEKDPPGVLRESGFGVEFPNYIVDVQKDENGEYREAIQFQCLERGGVRVFEGINFMSRNPTMTDQELTAMHARAEKAGMYPYGASPEQMHRVAMRDVNAPEIDNSWQQMWKFIGVDKLLELLTESIEDGGR